MKSYGPLAPNSKETGNLNNRQTNNDLIIQIKNIPPKSIVQFGMQPLKKQQAIDLIGRKSVYAVQKLLQNENYKKIPLIKSLLKNNKTQLEETFSLYPETADGDFLLFATGHKPGFLVCSFFKPDTSFLPENYKAIGDIILNKTKTREVIKYNYEWLKLLLNDENIKNEEDIFNCVINSNLQENPLYRNKDYDGIPTMKDALIGIFLGYPLEDVQGFIAEPKATSKICGYWKVYHNVDEKQKLFERFKKCTDCICRRSMKVNL